MGQQVLVVGPGWLGHEAAEVIARAGARVWTLRRGASTGESIAPSTTQSNRITELRGDIRSVSSPSGALAPWTDALPRSLDHLVLCIAPSRLAGDSHEDTYPAATRGAMALARSLHCPSVLYTSSTGVYGRTDGGESREADVIEPRDARQRALLDAESMLTDPTDNGHISRTILRVAGLYGPNRDPSSRLRRSIPSAQDDVWCNFSWRDDVVSAIMHSLEANVSDRRARILNCADGMPLRASHIAQVLGAPASTSADTAPVAHSATRTNQQIRVDRLRELGWTPTMPTVFDGLRALGVLT